MTIMIHLSNLKVLLKDTHHDGEGATYGRALMVPMIVLLEAI